MKKLYLGKKIKQLRFQLDFNQTQMAEQLGLSQSYYAAIEMSKRPVTKKILDKLSNNWKEWGAIYQENEGETHPNASIYNGEIIEGLNGGVNGGIDEKINKNDKLYKEYRIPSIESFTYKTGDSKVYLDRFFQNVKIQKNNDWLKISEDANENLRKIGFYYQRILDVKILLFNELNIKSDSNGYSVEKEADIMHSVVGGHIAEGSMRINNSNLDELIDFNRQLSNVAGFFELRFFGFFKLLYTGLRKKNKQDNPFFKLSFTPETID